jgi:hypothetical protein
MTLFVWSFLGWRSGLCNKAIDAFLNEKTFYLGACFLIFLKKIKKQAPKHHCISPPEAAKYFLHNLSIFSAFPCA